MAKISAKWVNVISAKMTVSAKSANFTAADNYIYLVNTTGGAISIQLPAPVSGLQLYIKDAGFYANVNKITILRSGSEKIENTAASYTIDSAGSTILITSDGTDYYIL